MAYVSERRKQILGQSYSQSQGSNSQYVSERRKRILNGFPAAPQSQPEPKAERQTIRQTSQPTQNLAMLNRVDDLPKSDASAPINQVENIGGYRFGTNTLPVYENDPWYSKAGKSAVNWAAGIPGAAINVLQAPGELLRQASIQTGNLMQGKELQPFKKTSLIEDVLPKQVDQGITKLEEKSPFLGGLSRYALEAAADPTTYVGGGIVDDMMRAGTIGKAARAGTAENLALTAERNMKGMTPGVRSAVSQADETVQAVNPQRFDVLDTTEAADGTYQYIKNKNTGTEKFVKVANAPELPKAQGRAPGESPLPRAAAETMDRLETSALPRSQAAATTEPRIPEGMTERGFSRNTRTDINNPDELRQAFDENPLTYKQVSNQDTIAKAEAIYNQGYESARTQVTELASKMKPEAVPLAKMLAREATTAGNVEGAREILAEVASKLTEAGQFSQAARLLRESDPETFLLTLDKQLKKLNEQGAKQYGKKWSKIDLTQSENDMIRKMPRGNEQAFEDAMEQIGSRIAKELPSTGMEKFDAWRRMAMLLNPKTHIRNVIGNTIMMGMRKSSDTVGAALEKAFVPKGQRTKSVGWSLDKNIVNKVDAAWEANKKDLLGESRWEIDNLKALGREKQIFKKGLPTKAAELITGKEFEMGALEKINKSGMNLLNLEDNLFVKRAYKDALGQYIKSNGLDAVDDVAQAYAKRRALEATFKQVNALSRTIGNLKRTPGIGKFVEGAIPFSKTPANIAARAVEYSPAGLIKALYSKTAGKPAADVVEDLAKGLTGTALSATGFLLASMGWAKANRSRSDKAEGIMRELGEQPYSINTPLGSYTFDWAQPFAVPLAMGMSMYESLESRKDGDGVIQAVIDGLTAGGDTIFNMTMLRSIKDILGSGGSPMQKILGIPLAYIEQAIPTVMGQTGRTIDDTYRNTYDPNPAQQEINKIKGKLGFTSGLEPKLDVFGNEQAENNLGVRAFSQFLSPGNSLENKNDPASVELKRLYKSTKETDFLPKLEDGRFTDNGKDVNLTAKQLTEFQRSMGQANYQEISSLISMPEYKNAEDSLKAKYIRDIVDRNYEAAKRRALEQSK
jgi:hypothetical protein